MKNLVFGFSGTVGYSFYKLVKNNKNYIFSSKNKSKNFCKWNLNKSLKKFPVREVKTCYFFSSPRILKKNMKKKIFEEEYYWLKNVITNIKVDKIVYLSSSSIYYGKNHVIGKVKKKCENLILKNKNNFSHYQIWRPYNLLSSSYITSDHFHNFLFKKMFIEKRKNFNFFGNENDMRGYSDVNDFTKILYKYSKKNISFVREYGNRNLVKVKKIIELFNEDYFKLNNNYFKAKFNNKKNNINCIKLKKNSIYSEKKSIIILKQYLNKSLNEKKM